MKILRTITAVLDRLIWLIGLMTICNFAQQLGPTVYSVFAYVLVGGFAIWYFYKSILLPFRDGLLGR